MRLVCVVVGVLVALLCSWSAAAQPLAATGDLLTLDQAVSLALERNRTLRSNALDVEKLDDARAALQARRKPSLDLNVYALRLLGQVDLRFPAGAFGVFPATGPIPPEPTTVSAPPAWSSIVFFRAAQPITQLFKIGLGESQLRVARDLASERVRSQRQSTINSIRRLYYGLLQTENAHTSLRQSIAAHEEIDRLVAQYVREGVALQSDALEVQALIARQRAGLDSLRNTQATMREQMNALIGRDIATPFTVGPVAEAPAEAGELAVLERRALDNRPEVKQAALAVQQAELDVRIKRAAFIPDVSAMVTYIGLFNVQMLPPAIAGAGVTASWEPWDWGRKKREVAQSQKGVEQARGAVQDAEALVRIEVRTSFRKYQEARSAIPVNQSAAEVLREKLRVATALNREQKNLLRDVLQAQAALAAADQQYNDALLGLGTARADLDKALGEQ